MLYHLTTYSSPLSLLAAGAVSILVICILSIKERKNDPERA